MSPKEKIILITGATDGLGKAVAIELARRGAILLVHGRNPEKGKAVLQEIERNSEHDNHQYYNADLSSLEEVVAMSDKILAEHQHIDILINNAGIGGGKRGQRRQLGQDGYELIFTVNYLAPFLLTENLLPLLQQSAPSKIVNISSAGQSPINFNDVMLERGYDGYKAYAQSKLAQVMHTFSLAEALKDTGVTVNCLHPATLMDTNMVRQSDFGVHTTVAAGVDTVLYVILSPETEKISGAYFDLKKQSKALPQAYDMTARKKLEEISRQLIREAIHR